MKTLHEAALEKFGSPAAVAKAIQNNLRRLRYQPKVPHARYELVGGPLAGHTVELSSPSTGVITVGAYCGSYRSLSERRNGNLIHGIGDALSRSYVPLLHWQDYHIITTKE